MNPDLIGGVSSNTTRVIDSHTTSVAAISVETNVIQTANAPKQAAAPPSLDQVKQAVSDINESMQAQSHGLVFSIDSDSNRTIVKVVDQQTSEVIRQIPSEETIAIAKSLDQVIGKLLQEKA